MSSSTIAPGLTLLDSGYVAAETAAFYVLQDQNQLAIIETGTQYSLTVLKRFLDQLSIEPQMVRYIIPTHVHLDHAGGAGAMMQFCSSAQLVVHHSGARHLIDPQKLTASAKSVYGEERFKTLYGDIIAVDKARVIEVKESIKLNLGNRSLHIFETPGHAWHHCSIWDETSGGMFTGDTFGLCYPALADQADDFIFPTTTPTQFNPEALKQSIESIRAFNPKSLYLTHFGHILYSEKFAERYLGLIEYLLEYTRKLQPAGKAGLSELVDMQNKLVSDTWNFSQQLIQQTLAMDFDLNAQGLLYWYQKQHTS